MPPASTDRYADWKAPAEDGAVLLWPAADALLRDTEANARRLASAHSVTIQGVPLPQLRQGLRQWVGHREDDRPLVAMGHQTELYHPGVWAKDALIDAVATRLGGSAYHVAVDTDEPKHLTVRWPGGAEPLTDEPPAAEWAGLLPSPTPAHLDHVARSFSRAASGWDFRPVAGGFFDSMRRLTPEARNLPLALVNAMHELDWSLGLRHHALLFSPLAQSESYLLLAHHVLARADAFAADYNASLDDYRREHRVRAPGRPMPNLKVTADSCEVPFWLDLLGSGRRARATVHRCDGGWALRVPGGEEFCFDAGADPAGAARRLAAWLRHHDARLSPRALTLTLVLRLLLADQFAHGIGGARYDQVTDRLIERHFGLEAPRFSVTTATLYFPAAAGRARACVSCLRHEGHRLRHRALGDGKRRVVEMIGAAPRGSIERSVMFHDLRTKLTAAALRDPRVIEWEGRLKEAEGREREEEGLFDRELFYAVQPRERLASLVSRYRDGF